MNYNILSYAIYVPIIFFIMIKVGQLLYKNGAIFLNNMYKNDLEIAQNIKKLL